MYIHWALARGCCAPLRTPGSRAADGAANARGRSPRTPAPVRSHRAAAHRVVTRIERMNRAAYGPAEALRLPKVEEPVQEAVSAHGEPRTAALLGIADHPAAGDLVGHLHPHVGVSTEARFAGGGTPLPVPPQGPHRCELRRATRPGRSYDATVISVARRIPESRMPRAHWCAPRCRRPSGDGPP